MARFTQFVSKSYKVDEKTDTFQPQEGDLPPGNWQPFNVNYRVYNEGTWADVTYIRDVSSVCYECGTSRLVHYGPAETHLRAVGGMHERTCEGSGVRVVLVDYDPKVTQVVFDH